MNHPEVANFNGSMLTDAVAVDSKPNSKSKKMKVYKVLVLSSSWGEEAHLRVFQIAAKGQRDANRLVKDVFLRLYPEQIEAISVNAHEIGEGVEDQVELFDVFESRYTIPGHHAWTREEIECADLDKLIIDVAKELEAAG